MIAEDKTRIENEEIQAKLDSYLLEPNHYNWQQILAILDKLEQEDLQSALNYLKPHIGKWPNELKTYPEKDWMLISQWTPDNFVFQICASLELCFFEDSDAIELSKSGSLSELKILKLFFNELTDEGVTAIAQSETLKGLETLNIRENEFGTEGALAIAKSVTLENLSQLNIGGNVIGDEGTKAIVNSYTLRNLTSLGLAGCDLKTEGALAIAESQTLTKLKELNLRNNRIGFEGAEALAKSSNLSAVESLCLVDCLDEGYIDVLKNAFPSTVNVVWNDE